MDLKKQIKKAVVTALWSTLAEVAIIIVINRAYQYWTNRKAKA